MDSGKPKPKRTREPADTVTIDPSGVSSIVQKNKPRLFELLRKELGPVFAEMGLVEMPPDPASRSYVLYYGGQSRHGSAIGLWFQRHVKASSVAAFGSSFTLEFEAQTVETQVYRGGGLRHRERLSVLLSPSEREEMRIVQNRVIGRMIALREHLLRTTDILPFEYQIVGDSLDPVVQPYGQAEDVWMRFRVNEDILDWAGFLKPLLPSKFEGFLNTHP
jgi:hypothetical protein